MADALQALLTKSRLRVAVNDTDPATIPVTYLERLQTYDCIVLVGKFADADVQMIRNHGGRVVDTRSTLATQIAGATDGGRQVLTPGPAGIAAVYTGVVPIVYKARHTVGQLDSEQFLVVRHDHAVDDVRLAQRPGGGDCDVTQHPADSRDFRRHGLVWLRRGYRFDDGGQHRAGRRRR